MLASIAEGWSFALAFSPIFSMVGSAACAALLARRPGPGRRSLALGVLTGAWLLGDGMRVIGQARALVDSGGGDAAAWVMLAVWAAGSLGLGYIAPAWAGTFVGRRVTRGTGWISAAVVAATVSAALGAIGTAL